MLLNNIELDVKTKCIEEGTTQTKIAEEIGTSKSYVSRIGGSIGMQQTNDEFDLCR